MIMKHEWVDWLLVHWLGNCVVVYSNLD